MEDTISPKGQSERDNGSHGGTGNHSGTGSHSGCVRWLKANVSLTQKGATPFNWQLLFIVVSALFGSAYSITFLFPFLPDMVLHFGYSEEDKGYYVGYIASAMFVGRVFGSFPWGWLSDKFGRRPIILFTLVTTALSNLAFGFSVNLTMAITVRFLGGLFNGIVGSCKTVLYEISDNTNQAVGMSAIAWAWGSGVILGPLISGVLAEPAKKYPSVFPPGSLFDIFPFLLPSLVATAICFIGLVGVWWKMPETLSTKTSSSDMVVGEASTHIAEERPADHWSSNGGHAVSKTQSMGDLSSLPPTADQGSVLTSPRLTHVNSLVSLRFADSGSIHEEVYNVYGLGQIQVSQSNLVKNTNKSRQSLTRATEEAVPLTQATEEAVPLTQATEEAVPLTQATEEAVPLTQATEEAVPLTQATEEAVPLTQATEEAVPLTQATEEAVPLTQPAEEAMPFLNGSTVHKNGTGNGNVAGDRPVNGRSGVEERQAVVKVVDGRTVIDVVDNDHQDGHKTNRCCLSIRNMVFCRLLRSRDVIISMVLYTLYSFAVIGWEDVFVVWASTAPRLGGLGFSAEDIGKALGTSSTVLLCVQVWLYPKLVGKFGPLRVLQGYCVYLIFMSSIVACYRFLLDEPVALWTVLLITVAVQKMAVTSCFSSLSIFVNNSVEPQDAGSINGIGLTFSAIGRAAAPAFCGSLFAWSITSGAQIGFPFDVNFVFILMGLVYLVLNILSSFTPRSLEMQKKRSNQGQ